MGEALGRLGGADVVAVGVVERARRLVLRGEHARIRPRSLQRARHPQVLRAALRGADAVLIATPEYNHSIPGVLKNALDWASRPAGHSALSGTPAAAIGASTGIFGAVWAQAETRKVLGALGGLGLGYLVGAAGERYAVVVRSAGGLAAIAGIAILTGLL